ncbi:unnamed protein product, partial [Prorocentrum cordatum]
SGGTGPSFCGAPRAHGPRPEVLCHEVVDVLLAELAEAATPDAATGEVLPPQVSAMVPLHGFAGWILDTQAWEDCGLEPPLAEAVRRAAQGAAGFGADREVTIVDEDGDEVTFSLEPASSAGVG